MTGKKIKMEYVGNISIKPTANGIIRQDHNGVNYVIVVLEDDPQKREVVMTYYNMVGALEYAGKILVCITKEPIENSDLYLGTGIYSAMINDQYQDLF